MVARNFFLLLLNCSAWVLLSEIFFGSTVLCSSLRTLITCTCLQVEDNAAAAADTAPAGCVIVMPGELDNGDDDEEDEDDNDERNSETAALTSSC